MSNDNYSRRHFLRGAGGVTLAIPFLESLVPKALAQSNSINPRFVAFISKYGQRAAAFYPTIAPNMKSGDANYLSLASTSGAISTILGADFNSLKTKMTLFRGLDGLDVSGHNRSVPLTASHHIEKEAREKAPRFPYSIDAVIEGSAIGKAARLGALRLGPYPKDFNQSFSFNKRNGIAEALPNIWSDVVAFRTVFGVNPVVMKTASIGTQSVLTFDKAATRRNLIINHVLEDLNRVMGSRRISSEDKQKLSNYADLVNELQQRIDPSNPVPTNPTPTNPSPTNPAPTNPTPTNPTPTNPTPTNPTPTNPTPTNPVPTNPTPGSCAQPGLRSTSDAHKLVRNHLDIMIAALACGQTNVATFVCHHVDEILDPSYDYAHEPSHASNPATQNKYNTWTGQHYAYLLNGLNAFKEANGKTVLDNSIVMWANELSEGESHSVFSMPIVVAGSAGGRLRSGYYIDYTRANMSLVDGYKAGRPYNELLITLMQAMGLTPAQYQRDGLKGFGTYDGMIYSDKAKYMSYYAAYLANKDAPLPFYWVG